MAELDRAAICSRIQLAREEAGLTQPEFGEALSPPVHWRTVQTWESVKQPRVPWDRLDQIAKITGRSKEWLLHGQEHAGSDLATRLESLEGQVAELARAETVEQGFAAVEEAIERLAERLSPPGAQHR